jgi:acyl-CoA thioester hydrolase
MKYEKSFEVRWADLDPNFHLRHTAYNDYAAHVRFSCLADNGFSMKRFQELNLGPVIFKETTEYFKEVRSGDTITLNFLVAGVSEDGRKFRVQHDILKKDGTKAATITVEGAWFNTQSRKVVPAPVELVTLLKNLPQTASFAVI